MPYCCLSCGGTTADSIAWKEGFLERAWGRGRTARGPLLYGVLHGHYDRAAPGQTVVPWLTLATVASRRSGASGCLPTALGHAWYEALEEQWTTPTYSTRGDKLGEVVCGGTDSACNSLLVTN